MHQPCDHDDCLDFYLPQQTRNNYFMSDTLVNPTIGYEPVHAMMCSMFTQCLAIWIRGIGIMNNPAYAALHERSVKKPTLH